MYSITYHTLSDIEQLEVSWRHLEKGADMTYFQRFDWYKMLATLNNRVSHKCFETVIAEVVKENQTVIIAPLWIVKKDFGKYNQRGVYFFSRGQWSDYQNIIYADFDSQAVDELLCDVKKQYGVSNFIFEDVPTKSAFFQYINNKYTHLTNEGNVCVELHIPENLEAYHKMLSKNARQNIRTAFNRAEKDGITFSFDFDDKNVNIEEFKAFREAHLGDKIRKGGTTLKSKIVYFISTKILGRGVYSFAPYTPFQDDKSAHFITCRNQDGKLCAAYCYGIDDVHNSIVLMAVATNGEFYKYSPGILSIYMFVIEQMEKNGYARIDFTRGNEKYKFMLGGQEHYNQDLKFVI